MFPGCSGPNCQPAPFYNPSTNTLGTGATDHSNLFKNVQQDLCPKYDYDYWKGVALSGGKNVYYYRSDGVGSPTRRSTARSRHARLQAVTGLRAVVRAGAAPVIESVRRGFESRPVFRHR